jgi:hypothetical protein
MKALPTLASLLLFSGGSAYAAADLPPLAFPSPKIELPPLSLLGNSLAGLPDAPFDFGQPTALESKSISRMPILVPRDDVDQRMVRAPNPSIGYKGIVKQPEIAPAK